MERAVFVNNLNNLGKLKRFDRIYYGSEFCQNLIPVTRDLDKIFSITNKVTLLTPYVTGYGLEKLEPLFNYLDKQEGSCEVVFNDWGVFKLIKDKYNNINPVLGRLLTKQKRDPWLREILFSKQKFSKVFFDNLTNTKVITKSKRIPKALSEYFKDTPVNAPILQGFLLKNKIRRIEIDNLAWEMKINVNKNLGVTMHWPYGYLSTTRLCGLINLTYSKCSKKCQKYFFSFKKQAGKVPIYIRGNTVFYKTRLPENQYLERMGINRLVYYNQVPI